MNLKIIWIYVLCILVASCQKRKYADEKVQLKKEEIYLSAYVNNEPVSLKIGTDGYYCYSSYEQRTDSIYVFEGELRKFDCNPCPLSLKVLLSDYRQRSPGSAIPADSALDTGNRNFIPEMPRVNTVAFTAHSNKLISSLRWNLSNGSTSDDTLFNTELLQPGLQTVSLSVTTKNGCEDVIINKIFVGGENGLLACTAEGKALQGNSSEFKAIIIGGKGPFTYNWNFGDGESSSSPAPTHSYQWAGSYPVTLQVKDAEGHVCESNYTHIAGNDNSSCSANMSLSITGSRNAFLSGVKIQWTDQSNTTLSSDKVSQPAESYFEIVDSQTYAPNERGEAGRLLSLRFNVLLSDGNRNIWFKSENTAIAVAYK